MAPHRAALGVGTFALRLPFIQLSTGVDGLPSGVERALQFVPVAVLAALVLPAVVPPSPTAILVDGRLLAGVVGWLVARRTGNMMATIAVGMGVLWGVQFAVG